MAQPTHAHAYGIRRKNPINRPVLDCSRRHLAPKTGGAQSLQPLCERQDMCSIDREDEPKKTDRFRVDRNSNSVECITGSDMNALVAARSAQLHGTN